MLRLGRHWDECGEYRMLGKIEGEVTGWWLEIPGPWNSGIVRNSIMPRDPIGAQPSAFYLLVRRVAQV